MGGKNLNAKSRLNIYLQLAGKQPISAGKLNDVLKMFGEDREDPQARIMEIKETAKGERYLIFSALELAKYLTIEGTHKHHKYFWKPEDFQIDKKTKREKYLDENYCLIWK